MALDDSYTVSLLHMDGADTSVTFTDESGKAWTAQDNAQIDTAQSVFGGASGLFDGTNDYLVTGDSADWQLDGGSNSNQWTFDARIRFNGDPGTGNQGIFSQNVDNDNFIGFKLDTNTLRFIVRSGGADIIDISNAWNPAGDTWYHVALVKNGATGYLMFVAGAQIGVTQTDTSTLPNLAGNMRIGRHTTSGGTVQSFNGWMDEVRFSKGIARWTANFVPQTSPYLPPSGGVIWWN